MLVRVLCEVSVEVGGFAGLGQVCVSPCRAAAPLAVCSSGCSPTRALILNAALVVLLIED